MKDEILKTLTENYKANHMEHQNALNKLLNLHGVIHQRELLIDFIMYVEECYGMDQKEKAERCVDDYLTNL